MDHIDSKSMQPGETPGFLAKMKRERAQKNGADKREDHQPAADRR